MKIIKNLLHNLFKNKFYLFTQHKNNDAPVDVVKAKGVHLYLADGRKVLDGISSWWVNTVGHGRPEIADAISTLDFFVDNRSDDCLEKGCDNLRTTQQYCRLHYIANWHEIKRKREKWQLKLLSHMCMKKKSKNTKIRIGC